MPSTVAVLGAGSWGTTLADLLARQGHTVRLWAYEPETVRSVNERHENELFLPGCPLAPTLRAWADPAEAVAGAPVILSVSPSHAVRSVLQSVAPAIAAGTLLISASKGIENGTLQLMHEVIADTVPQARLAVLSGPSFAAEVYQRQPTAVAAAAAELREAEATQELFSSARFRVYTNQDVVGVELCGALKNVIAIAAGVLEGLGMGHNPRAALITRGLAEITRLGLAMGAQPMTFMGLAGMGDLILTTTGNLSRNRSLGVALAQGASLEEYTRSHRTVAEGVNTARAAVALAAKHGVELPITGKVAEVLFEGKTPKTGITELMERELKAEHWR